jgi:hypothetical protein
VSGPTTGEEPEAGPDALAADPPLGGDPSFTHT